jgi:hypothetical protein
MRGQKAHTFWFQLTELFVEKLEVRFAEIDIGEATVVGTCTGISRLYVF